MPKIKDLGLLIMDLKLETLMPKAIPNIIIDFKEKVLCS
jgi:hypothetical protein